MPHTEILVFQEANGDCPFKVWLDDLESRNLNAYAKCLERILRLSELGYELRRPLADYVDDDIYELRISAARVQYRILYFFHGRNVAVIAHGITKESKIPSQELKRAVDRKKLVERNANLHTAELDLDDNG